MAEKFMQMTPQLHDYLLNASLRESDILKKLRDETATMTGSIMQIPPEQGQFMAFLVELINAKKIIEVGTFTGYSALVMAQALPDNGRLITCDISEESTNVAKRYWQEAGLSNKIDLKLGSALDTLNQLIAEDQQNSFDFAFIDADKQNYQNYYEACLTLLRPGGLIIFDNVLYSGMVADEKTTDKNALFFRKFNNDLRNDQRVSISMLTVADGITLAQKK